MSGFFFNDFPYTDFHELNLSWVLKQIKALIEHMKQIDTWKEEYQSTVDDLEKFYDDLINGRYPQEFVDNLYRWMSVHGPEIITKLIKMVFFGITDDGYFVAYIPDSWDDITFGTSGLDDFPAGIDYGHLTLTY